MRNLEKQPTVAYARAVSVPKMVGSTNRPPAIGGIAATANFMGRQNCMGQIFAFRKGNCTGVFHL